MARTNAGPKEIVLAIDTATTALVVGIGVCEIATPPSGARNDSSLRGQRSRRPSASGQAAQSPSLITVLASHFSIADRKHLELSTITIEETVKKAGIKLADLSAIVVGLGPGSLIGARVGVVVAKTLAQVLKAPLIGISTLDVIEAGPSKKIGKELYPTPEALIKLGFDKLKKGQFSSLYELEPIYLKGPV